MLSVNEVSKRTGVSVRSLHHYDAIGLLKPAKVTEAGYRLYGDAELVRLQNIMLFRELQFPLKQIKKILDNPDFDQKEALAQQIQLLELQLRHIHKLISFAREIQEKGVEAMKETDFKAFDQSELAQYAKEVSERWGATADILLSGQRRQKPALYVIIRRAILRSAQRITNSYSTIPFRIPDGKDVLMYIVVGKNLRKFIRYLYGKDHIL